jgi:hypothetical protein
MSRVDWWGRVIVLVLKRIVYRRATVGHRHNRGLDTNPAEQRHFFILIVWSFSTLRVRVETI